MFEREPRAKHENDPTENPEVAQRWFEKLLLLYQSLGGVVQKGCSKIINNKEWNSIQWETPLILAMMDWQSVLNNGEPAHHESFSKSL